MFTNPNNLVFLKKTITPTNVRVCMLEKQATEVTT